MERCFLNSLGLLLPEAHPSCVEGVLGVVEQPNETNRKQALIYIIEKKKTTHPVKHKQESNEAVCRFNLLQVGSGLEGTVSLLEYTDIPIVVKKE